MSNNGGSTARVSIPNNVKKTIQNIKEITGNHSEDDIYSMLKECSMDPNETTQRLLLLDTFHDVKRKRDKRNENVKSRPAEESRGKPGYQGCGIRGARGSSYFQYSSHDVGGRGNTSIRRENGVGESREKGFRRSPMPASKEIDPAWSLHVEKSPSVSMTGPVKVSNGSLNGECVPHSSGACDGYLSNANKDTTGNSSSMPKGGADHALSASDPVLVPSCDSRIPTPVGTIKREVNIQQVSSESSQPLRTNKKVGTTEISTGSGTNRPEPQNVDEPKVSSPITEKGAFDDVNVSQQKIPSQCSTAGNLSDLKVSSPPGVEKAISKMEKLKFSDGKHVIIPIHIQVPDAVKNVLSFGSLDASFGARENYKNSESNQELDPVADSDRDEIANKPPSCDQYVVSTVPEEQVDLPQSPSQLSEKNSASELKVPSFATDSKHDQPKEETLPAVGPPFPVVQTAPSYGFGFMPPMLVNPHVQPEGFESQAQMLNTQTGSAPVSTSSSTPPPPPPQSVGAGQSSVALSPQPIALFRQPYPSNYVPYSHYYSIYVPSTMHQYFGHTTFPPHLPGNVYLPSSAAASVMKLSPPPYKPGVGVGNQAPIGVPSGYGAYSSSQVGVGLNASITSGNSNTSEDLMPSTLKENIYPGQQSEGSTIWLSGAGRDAASFPLNSFLNLPPQGHVITPQPGHGTLVYHALPSMVGPVPPGLALLQQSQPMAGPIESVGPPTNGYQQPQCQQQHQANWNI